MFARAMAWAALPVILGENYLRENRRNLSKMIDALVVRNRKASLLAHFEALLAYPPPSLNARKVSHRCLVISGAQDLLVHPKAARQLAELTDGVHEEFEQIGHSVPVEATERFNRVCRRFLNKPSLP